MSITPAPDDSARNRDPPPQWCFLCQASAIVTPIASVNELLDMAIANQGAAATINPRELAKMLVAMYNTRCVKEIAKLRQFPVVPQWTEQSAYAHLTGQCNGDPLCMAVGLKTVARAMLSELLTTWDQTNPGAPPVGLEQQVITASAARDLTEGLQQLGRLTVATQQISTMQREAAKLATQQRMILGASLAGVARSAPRPMPASDVAGAASRASSAAKRIAAQSASPPVSVPINGPAAGSARGSTGSSLSLHL